MAKYSVGAIVQLKTGGIHGYVESLIEPDSEHPKYWCKWDSGSYQVHQENKLRPATVDGPQLYKTLA
ncbi:hypothetical protein RG59_04950 [Escherichia coli]|nr:hypothetical protein RG59_04950 [Escherichia coli]KDF67447.1 hypothetical protein AE34_02907 [Escherichia coli BIDMC 59]EFI4421359.1 hypothetical protein [Escherichia coli]EFN5088174.1 hypothetical protein [Escherichia coli]RBX81780.1 hypothetical protein DS977_02430 [Escherichia coli]